MQDRDFLFKKERKKEFGHHAFCSLNRFEQLVYLIFCFVEYNSFILNTENFFFFLFLWVEFVSCMAMNVGNGIVSDEFLAISIF